MTLSWRRRACARAGTSRPSRHIWSACSPTVSGCFSGRRFAAAACIGPSTSWLAGARSSPRRRSPRACVRVPITELSPPITGPLSGLTDVLVHGGDIRIPLGLPFEPDPQLCALRSTFSPESRALGFVPFGRLRGIRLQASDIDRSWGSGAEIRGPVRALLMAASGRDALFDRLDGPGLPVLRNRLTAFRNQP